MVEREKEKRNGFSLVERERGFSLVERKIIEQFL